MVENVETKKSDKKAIDRLKRKNNIFYLYLFYINKSLLNEKVVTK